MNSKLKDYIQVLGPSIIFAVVIIITAMISYNYGKNKYLNQLNEYKVQVAKEANKQYEELNAKYQSSLETIALLNSRLSTVSDLLDDSVKRVQYYSSRVEQLPKNTSKSYFTELKGCVNLLTEGTKLSGEGGKLLKEFGVNHETTVKLINGE